MLESLLKLIPSGRHYSVIIYISAVFLFFALFLEKVYVDRFSLIAILCASMLFGISEMINHSDEKQFKPYVDYWTKQTSFTPDGIKHVRKMTKVGGLLLIVSCMILIIGLYNISTL